MYTVSLQLLLKGDLSKFLEELIFGTYRARVKGFLAELQNAEVSVTLPKSDSTTDALTAILRILQTNKDNTCGWLSFPYSYRWVDWPVRTV